MIEVLGKNATLVDGGARGKTSGGNDGVLLSEFLMAKGG